MSEMDVVVRMSLALGAAVVGLIGIGGIWLEVLWISSRDQRVLDAVHVGIVREDQDAQAARAREVAQLVRARLDRYDAAAREDAWARLERLVQPESRPRLGVVMVPAAPAQAASRRITRGQALWRRRVRERLA